MVAKYDIFTIKNIDLLSCIVVQKYYSEGDSKRLRIIYFIQTTKFKKKKCS